MTAITVVKDLIRHSLDLDIVLHCKVECIDGGNCVIATHRRCQVQAAVALLPARQTQWLNLRKYHLITLGNIQRCTNTCNITPYWFQILKTSVSLNPHAHITMHETGVTKRQDSENTCWIADQLSQCLCMLNPTAPTTGRSWWSSVHS